MDTIQGRSWKVGLDENTGLTCKYLSYGKLCSCFHSPRGGEERVFSPPAPSSVYIRLCKQGKEDFYCFCFFLKKQNSLLEAFN